MISAAGLGDACTKEDDCSLITDATCDTTDTNTCICIAGYIEDGLGGCIGKFVRGKLKLM